MDKIHKFFNKLNRKDRAIFTKLFSSIQTLNLDGYDIKALSGMKGIFRLRKGSIRIVFAKYNKKGIILNIGFRKDIYKSKGIGL